MRSLLDRPSDGEEADGGPGALLGNHDFGLSKVRLSPFFFPSFAFDLLVHAISFYARRVWLGMHLILPLDYRKGSSMTNSGADV